MSHAIEETDDGLWDVHCGPMILGRFHEPLLRIEEANGKLVRNPNHSRPVLPIVFSVMCYRCP